MLKPLNLKVLGPITESVIYPPQTLGFARITTFTAISSQASALKQYTYTGMVCTGTGISMTNSEIMDGAVNL
jgi:hypothetical protein